jgi:hypothetical protein
MTDNITLRRAVAEKLRKALFDWAECHNDVADFCDDDKEILAALDAALAEPEPDAIARAVEAAVKECVTICERQRMKILQNPNDPSWTEHLAEVQSAMKQRFSVEMGYPALAEPEPTVKESLQVDALRRWANTDDGPTKTKWQGGYDAARRWVREVALPALAEPEPVAKAWAEGYQQGVQDERTSEASIGIAGFGAKVEPARQNPYAALPPPEPPAKPEPATMQQIVATHRTTYGAPWLDQFDRAWKAAERFHGIKKEDKT